MQPDRTAFWVPNRDKDRLKKRIDPTKDEFDGYDPGCLLIVDSNGRHCGESVTGLNHTIPNSAVLSPLSYRGQVLEVFWGFGNFFNLFVQGSEKNPVDMSDIERFRPRPIGIDEASCGRFACKNPPESDHDGVFGPIDKANPDFDHPLVAFLVPYRANLWALYQLKRADSMMEEWKQKIMRQGLPVQRNEWIKNKDLLRRLLPFMQEKVSRLGIHWHTDRRSANTANQVVAGQQFHFRSKLTFAASVFYGRSSVASIFPVESDLHQMGITNFVEDTQHDAEFTSGLIEVATASMQKDDYGVDMMAVLRDLSSGIVVMSPESYDNLSRTERNAINQWVQQLARADALAKNINLTLRNRQPLGRQVNKRR